MPISPFRHASKQAMKLGRPRTLAALSGAVLVLTGLAAPPASADDSRLDLIAGLQSPVALPANGVPTEADVLVWINDLSGQNTASAHDVTVTITLPSGGPVTGTTSHPGCTTADTTITCQIASLDSSSGQTVTIPVMLTAAAGTPDGTDAGLVVGATSPDTFGGDPAPQPVTVENRPNLSVVPAIAPLMEVPRRQRAALPQITVTNTGSLAAQGATIEFTNGRYAALHADYSNCQTSADGWNVICRVDNVIQPGETYEIVNPPTFRLPADTVLTEPGRQVDALNVDFNPGDDVASQENGGTFTAGTGKPLTLARTVGTGTPQTTSDSVPQQNLAGFDDNYFQQPIRATDGLVTDLAAVGARVAVSGTTAATVEVGVRNAGPALLWDLAGTGTSWVRFTVPGGATVTEAPSDCMPVTTDGSFPANGTPGYGEYECISRNLSPHASALWDFKVMLAAGVKKTTGSVLLHYVGDGGPGPFPAGWDTDPTNDTANVVLTAAS